MMSGEVSQGVFHDGNHPSDDRRLDGSTTVILVCPNYFVVGYVVVGYRVLLVALVYLISLFSMQVQYCGTMVNGK